MALLNSSSPALSALECQTHGVTEYCRLDNVAAQQSGLTGFPRLKLDWAGASESSPARNELVKGSSPHQKIIYLIKLL